MVKSGTLALKRNFVDIFIVDGIEAFFSLCCCGMHENRDVFGMLLVVVDLRLHFGILTSEYSQKCVIGPCWWRPSFTRRSTSFKPRVLLCPLCAFLSNRRHVETPIFTRKAAAVAATYFTTKPLTTRPRPQPVALHSRNNTYLYYTSNVVT